MGVLIRRVEVSDADEVGRLHAEVWRETYPGILSDELISGISTEERVGRWRQIVVNRGQESRWVAVVDDTIAGFVVSGPSRDADPIRAVELWSIHILRRFARRGIGRALAEEAIGDAPASVWVVTANTPAQAFYRSLGFELDGATSTIDMWDGVAECRMTR